MADVKGPLFSLSAKGSMKKTLTYQKTKSGHKVYKHTKPGDRIPFTPSMVQRDKRMFKNLIAIRWQSLTDDERAVWNDRVKNEGLAMSGWNLFYKKAFKDPSQYLDLMVYYSFNEIVDGEFKDLSGNGRHAILQPNYPSVAPTLVDGRSAKLGKAAFFDGDDHQTETANVMAFQATSQAYTFEALLKPDSYVNRDPDYGFLMILALDIEIGIVMRPQANDIRIAGLQDGSASFRGNFPYKKQLHVVIVYPGDGSDDREIFVNGDSIGTDSSGTVDDYSDELYVGRNRYTEMSPVVVDEARIWEHAKSPAEIVKLAKLYNLHS